ncbi:MAG TPA: tetratricopeptide repeat protein, partial [Pseudonocardiaceae bacterium]|nr:tetratricopeptide repeat protein [Pseudonocardiaceae bacterium]
MWSGLALRRITTAVTAAARLLADGDTDGAGRAYAKALAKARKQIGRAPAATGLAATAHIGVGRVHLARRDFAAADPEFLAAQQLQPHEWAGYYWAGCAAAHRSDFHRADWFFTTALATGQAPARTFQQRGFARIRLGQVDAAVADLDTAAAHRALDDNALVVLAALHLHRRDWARAEAALIAIPDDRRQPATDGMLGSALERQGRNEAAIAAYDLAVASGDRAPAVLFHQGLVAYRLGRFADSARAWTELCQRHPHGASYRRLVARAEYAAARQLIDAGRFGAALPRLVAGIDAQPAGTLDTSFAQLHRYAAAEAADAGDRDRARSLLTAARDDPWARDFRILLDRLDGNTQAAEREWNRINSEQAANPRTLFA